MGIRSFWFLIFVATLVAAVNLWPWKDGQPRVIDYQPQLEVVDIAREPEPVAVPVKNVDEARLELERKREHDSKVQLKPMLQQLESGGTVEQESNPRLVRMQDGTLIVDHFFRIAGGKGTADEPYQLLWELLLSVQRNFDGAAADSDLPQYVKFLDGKYVIISGVVVSQEAGVTQQFTMSDVQLDNCPSCKARTIFSTIDVKLKTPEDLQRGVLNVFTIRGRMRAAALRENGALLRVYALEDGEILSRTQQ